MHHSRQKITQPAREGGNLNVWSVIESRLAGRNHHAVDLLLSVIYDESRKFAAKYLRQLYPGTPYRGVLRRMRLDVL